jgi:SPP1 gp7 family putative phage head morphogenesis protein
MTVIESILMQKAARLSARARVLRLPRPPKPRVPIEIERRYAADLKRLLVNKLEQITRHWLIAALPSILNDAKTDLPTMDAVTYRRDNYGRTIDTVFNTMRVAFTRELTNDELDDLTRKYATLGQSFNRSALSETMKKVLGLDPIISEPYLAPIMRQFTDQNTNLIRSIGSEYFDKLQQDTYRHIQQGVYNKEYAGKIQSQYEQEFKSQFEKGYLKRRVNNAEARANLIARDQISKYNGQLNQTRQVALGITKYRWTTSGDERVRDSHAALNGQVFDWNDPPLINGVPLNPGDDFQCRCIGAPVFDEGVTDNQNLIALLNG